MINFKGIKIHHNAEMGFYFIDGVDVQWKCLENLKKAILKIDFGY